MTSEDYEHVEEEFEDLNDDADSTNSEFDDVPLPPIQRARRRNPLWHMPVGKTKFFAGQVAKSVSASARGIAQRAKDGRRYSVRTVTEDVNGVPTKGVRVGRTA